jgi:aminoglycoside phosphotransferase (APT) family kinase protein
MRAQNLRHGATGVVVRDSLGRIYIHRRTLSKDLYPGYWDFTAGGVLLDGEDPLEAARREAAEELGVTSELVSLGEADYTDDRTTYHAFRYETTWDGEIVWQPEEVSYGAWTTLEKVADLIADPTAEVMPDAVAVFADWLQERLADTVSPEQGWDSVTTIVEGTWVDRRPRRREVADALMVETRLMPRLAHVLPLAVPVPEVLDEEPLRVRHRMVPGAPSYDVPLAAEDGRRVGEFLRCLHDLPTQFGHGTGVPDIPDSRAQLLARIVKMFNRVVPLLPEERQEAGRDLLRDVARHAPATLIHGDLVPDHLRCTDGRVTGVIDWSDTRIGDPALDLAWVLYGAPEPFAEAVAASYGASDDELVRALNWRRLGPWHEVLWGLGEGGSGFVTSGLEGVLDRL